MVVEAAKEAAVVVGNARPTKQHLASVLDRCRLRLLSSLELHLLVLSVVHQLLRLLLGRRRGPTLPYRLRVVS